MRHLLAQRHLAVLICASALLIKLLVPTGYMIANQHGAATVMICSGIASETMAMPGMGDTMPDHGKTDDHGKVEMPCAYAGLSVQLLGAADPVMLVAALALVAAQALSMAPRPTSRPVPYLRPPLRGPPFPSK